VAPENSISYCAAAVIALASHVLTGPCTQAVLRGWVAVASLERFLLGSVAEAVVREPRFFGEVARALKDHGQVLLVGPAMTKLHFLTYLQRNDHALEARIVGIESADHPTDAQLVAHVRQYFHASPPRRAR
jgi:hypothetical protein